MLLSGFLSVSLCMSEVYTMSYEPLDGISPNLPFQYTLETKVNWFDFEVSRSKVKVTTRPEMDKIYF